MSNFEPQTLLFKQIQFLQILFTNSFNLNVHKFLNTFQNPFPVYDEACTNLFIKKNSLNFLSFHSFGSIKIEVTQILLKISLFKFL